jgi:hypothetical protein
VVVCSLVLCAIAERAEYLTVLDNLATAAKPGPCSASCTIDVYVMHAGLPVQAPISSWSLGVQSDRATAKVDPACTCRLLCLNWHAGRCSPTLPCPARCGHVDTQQATVAGNVWLLLTCRYRQSAASHLQPIVHPAWQHTLPDAAHTGRPAVRQRVLLAQAADPAATGRRTSGRSQTIGSCTT